MNEMNENEETDAVGSGNWLEGRGAARKPVASEAAPLLAGVMCTVCNGEGGLNGMGGCNYVQCLDCKGTGQRSSIIERSGPANPKPSDPQGLLRRLFGRFFNLTFTKP